MSISRLRRSSVFRFVFFGLTGRSSCARNEFEKSIESITNSLLSLVLNTIKQKTVRNRLVFEKILMIKNS